VISTSVADRGDRGDGSEAVNVIYHDQIDDAEDPAGERDRLRLTTRTGSQPYRVASRAL
jgi:hypothetical protein